ncbi:tyrosine-type recombinase/integrase [Cellulomonas sp. APG4]|uniref:Integrase n=2 Tax=Cellulomonas TaxID=1707 RepID=A0A0A0BYK9_9CELL|nr:tyrosine-type recombinase/integrase [Cellulomonas carbonis]KGM12742.1 integrase [Cellulomonas carbonis T26]MDT0166659.1 tyrosine-type recombinase/integrase [Actinotalea sp. AC32]NCT89479.1 tyrosine-type recombinase/integrase [Cellulomonas sp. APG4]GGC14021.1 site-specific integrase [Cellulomonas carbonis]
MGWVVERPRQRGRRYTGVYRDTHGRLRSAGTFDSRREAERAAMRAEERITDGTWVDRRAGRVTFRAYAEDVWLPSRHLEVSTLAAYRSYLRRHFIPFFGEMRLAQITASNVQTWVRSALDQGLSPRSIAKYHVMLHSVFARAVRDRLIAFNPCESTELPKVVTKKARTLTPEEYSAVLAEIPPRFKPMVMTAIETGLRWGELVALRPRHVDFLRRTITVEETIVEVSRKDSPTGERLIVKPYPKDDEPRTLRVSQGLLDVLAGRIAELGLTRDDLLFPSRETAGGQPLSRATFNTRHWRPAVERSEVDFTVRMHDLRHAHASWLLAGGADLKTVMERMGHSQIMTTQRYLHTLPEAQDEALAAFERIRTR